MKRDECSEQEQWVLEQVEQGEIADLKEQFGEAEEDRRLRAEFLEALLTDDIEGFKPHRRGVRISEAMVEGKLELENAQVSPAAEIRASHFRDEVKFQGARFNSDLNIENSHFSEGGSFLGAEVSRQLVATGAQFHNKRKKINFNAIKVDHSAFFDNAIFQGPVDFGNADIGRQFSVDGTQFDNEKEKINFNALKVGLDAFFDNAVFQGSADFVGADIGGQFSADGVQFPNEKGKAKFNAMKVGQGAFFRGAVFQGPVDFNWMIVQRSLYLTPLEEKDRTGLTIFQSGASFIGTEIHGQLRAHRLRILSESEQSNFNGLKVGQSALFEGAVLAGPITLNDAHMLDLRMGCKPIPALNLERAHVARELLINNTEIGKIMARNLTVRGPATLEKLNITAEGDLRDTSFQQLNIIEIGWPERKEGKARVWLDGIDFKALSTKKDPQEDEKWNSVLDWLSIARFNTHNYNKVDEYFQRCGLVPWAYKVFREGKKRGLRRRKWWEPGKYFTRGFWGWLAGYGRKPARTLWLIIPLILLGAFLFEPQFADKFLDTQSAFESIILGHNLLARVILSLDRFLPGVDLGLAKYWQPFYLGFWTWLYWYFLKIMGWITIPITLAAIYTKIR